LGIIFISYAFKSRCIFSLKPFLEINKKSRIGKYLNNKRGYAKHSSRLKLKRNQKKRFFMERLPEQDVSLADVLTQIDGHQPTPGQHQTTMDVNYINEFADRRKQFGALVNPSLVQIIASIPFYNHINLVIFKFKFIDRSK
jgi:hypothetical protein